MMKGGTVRSIGYCSFRAIRSVRYQTFPATYFQLRTRDDMPASSHGKVCGNCPNADMLGKK
jgi:hypothetical protein